MAMSLAEAARLYLQAGLCVLAADRAEKYPQVGSWRKFQKRLPTEAELSAWCANGHDALCVLCGEVSGHLEIIDFDGGGELFEAWWSSLPEDLRSRLVVERTQSGGYHVIYRCAEPVCGSLKLAQRKTDDGVVTLIETRGEGGLLFDQFPQAIQVDLDHRDAATRPWPRLAMVSQSLHHTPNPGGTHAKQISNLPGLEPSLPRRDHPIPKVL